MIIGFISSAFQTKNYFNIHQNEVRVYMKKGIFLAGVIATLFTSSLFAAETNTVAVLVQAIKADYRAENTSDLYYYTFKVNGNLPSNCGKSGGRFAKSGDANINKILQLAYALDAKVKVGLDGSKDCVITTAVVDDSY